MSSRRAVRLLLLTLTAVLTLVALGPPSFTWANDGVRVQHPWAQGLAAVAAALALVATALGARPRALQVAAGAAALALVATALGARPRALQVAAGAAATALLGLSAQRLAWRIDAVDVGLRERSLAGAVSLRWSEIEAVEPRDGSLTLRGRDGTRLVIGTARFEVDERIRLERTIARRVKESAR